MDKIFKRFKIEAEPFNSEILSSILWELKIEGINEEDNFLYVFASQESMINRKIISDQLVKLCNENLIKNYKVEEEIIKNKNWNEEWEKNLKVIKISDKIVIKPSFRDYKKTGDEIVITIDPKMSFGTGEHATTKLIMLMLEKYLHKGDKVLDVGSGTGILSIAAVKLDAKFALAIDNDAWCFENGLENLKLNGVENKIEFRNCEIKDVDEKDFTLIISNIQKNVLKDIAGEFKKRLDEGGKLILSGILEGDREEMVIYYYALGFELIDSMQIDEWVSLVFKFE